MTFDEWLISRLTKWGAYSPKAKQDGAYGRAVHEGLQYFQRAHGLLVSGVADAATVAALSKDNPRSPLGVEASALPPPVQPSWMREAYRLMGLKEVPGPKSNPIILGWAKALGGWVAGWYKDDATPWCGLFVSHCIGMTLPREVLPSNPLSALAWGALGRALSEPAEGAVMTFTRPGGGHVGFYVGEDATHYRILGGNQLNSVSETRVERGRLFDTRWPATGEKPVGGRVWLKADGTPTSKNEA